LNYSEDKLHVRDSENGTRTPYIFERNIINFADKNLVKAQMGSMFWKCGLWGLILDHSSQKMWTELNSIALTFSLFSLPGFINLAGKHLEWS